MADVKAWVEKNVAVVINEIDSGNKNGIKLERSGLNRDELHEALRLLTVDVMKARQVARESACLTTRTFILIKFNEYSRSLVAPVVPLSLDTARQPMETKVAQPPPPPAPANVGGGGGGGFVVQMSEEEKASKGAVGARQMTNVEIALGSMYEVLSDTQWKYTVMFRTSPKAVIVTLVSCQGVGTPPALNTRLESHDSDPEGKGIEVQPMIDWHTTRFNDNGLGRISADFVPVPDTVTTTNTRMCQFRGPAGFEKLYVDFGLSHPDSLAVAARSFTVDTSKF
jgi:hypothetical protein